jgi:hypothetical protein
MINLDGQISVSYVTSSDGYDYVQIEIEDKDSGIQFVRLQMGTEEFGMMVLGRGSRKCKVRLTESPNLGKVAETKTVYLPINPGSDKPFNLNHSAAIMASGLEVDGWMAKTDVHQNHHRTKTTKDGTLYMTYFHRYVEKEK